MGAGAFRDRVLFQRQDNATDPLGNVTSGAWLDLFPEINCKLTVKKGSEREEAGRLESAVTSVIRVRISANTRLVTTADRAVVNGEAHQIRWITDPTRRNRYLEMGIERGVAT